MLTSKPLENTGYLYYAISNNRFLLGDCEVHMKHVCGSRRHPRGAQGGPYSWLQNCVVCMYASMSGSMMGKELHMTIM